MLAQQCAYVFCSPFAGQRSKMKFLAGLEMKILFMCLMELRAIGQTLHGMVHLFVSLVILGM